MRIAIIHGYFLHDSGSAVYVRELVRELVRLGHELTLVCQEQRPEDFDFIDSFYKFDVTNSDLQLVFSRKPGYDGSCRVVQPNLGGRLLVYVPGEFPGFEALAFQDAPDRWISEYVEANIRALRATFERWPQDLVQANHTVMQPYVVRHALNGGAPYIVTIYGSALNFTVKADLRMIPYALEGLEGAIAITSLSEAIRRDVVEFASSHWLDVADKAFVILSGVDTERFTPIAGRAEALGAVAADIDRVQDDVLVFAGCLLWTKGLHYAVAALPLALEKRPRLHLIIAGEGPMREPLEELIDVLDKGRLYEAWRLVEEEVELEGTLQYGPVIPALAADEEDAYVAAARATLKSRIHFAGHLDHARLAPVYGAADISLAPSIFPEAFGLVSIEALASGALPVATYQTGLRSPLDVVATALDDPALKKLAPEVALTTALADSIDRLLETYPTKDPSFRARLHEIAAEHFSWTAVAKHYLELAHQ
ncbi:MAG: glycosyltransferase family 4 protein [Actinobacteria bacterium]|nr:glycosyltransferase family 4 protein [Actinomycetota bacterium]